MIKTQEPQSTPDMHDPGLVRIELHAQLLKNTNFAAVSAARASAADVQVIHQSSA